MRGVFHRANLQNNSKWLPMLYKSIFSIACFCLITNAVSAKVIEREFRVSTDIDKSKFFSEMITSVVATPNNFIAEYNGTTKTFNSKDITLDINTNIPLTDNSLKYSVRLIENTSSCFDSQDNVVIENITSLKLDNNVFELNKPIKLDFNATDSNSHASKNTLAVSFGSLGSDAFRCQGNIVTLVELSL
ncbi:hypothetical protein [Vibrio sp. NTOU-M3]|uniref:hypothetical protein n=1 Tax=unclassified Vibrio TaxID=2614977 RepID=UPI00349F2784